MRRGNVGQVRTGFAAVDWKESREPSALLAREYRGIFAILTQLKRGTSMIIGAFVIIFQIRGIFFILMINTFFSDIIIIFIFSFHHR